MPRASVYRNVERFRGGLVFKAQRLLYHSTLGSRVIQKNPAPQGAGDVPWQSCPRTSSLFGGESTFINLQTRPILATEGHQTTRRALAHNHPEGW